MRLVNGVAVTEGPEIQLGADEAYIPVCDSCYRERVKQALLRPDNSRGCEFSCHLK